MRHASTRTRVDPHKNLVGFSIGGVSYAINIWRVREIVQPLPLTPLPYTHPSIVGVADHRGEVVPVVDLRIQFGESPQNSRKTKWILLNLGEHVVGVVVDAVTGVFGGSEEMLRPAPVLGGGEQRRGIAGVTTHHDNMVFVIDPALIAEIIRPVLEESLGQDLAGRELESGQ